VTVGTTKWAVFEEGGEDKSNTSDNITKTSEILGMMSAEQLLCIITTRYVHRTQEWFCEYETEYVENNMKSSLFMNTALCW